MPPDCFAERLIWLKEHGFTVIGLDSALEQRRQAKLQPDSIVITIDDGFHSVADSAAPLLKSHDMPATIYVTSYYVLHSQPIFRLGVQYVFWKTSLARIDVENLVPGVAGVIDTHGEQSEHIMWQLIRYGERCMKEDARQQLLLEIGARLEVDMQELISSRRFHLLTVEELRKLVEDDFDIQLHTHRHQFPADEHSARREIMENREILEPIVGKCLKHFCYPSGVWSQQQWDLLRELGVVSATTTDYGINKFDTPELALKRICDTDRLSWIEFEALITGFVQLLQDIEHHVNNLKDKLKGGRKCH